MCFPDTLLVFINAISTISGRTVMPHFYPTKNDNSIHFRVIRSAALLKKMTTTQNLAFYKTLNTLSAFYRRVLREVSRGEWL